MNAPFLQNPDNCRRRFAQAARRSGSSAEVGPEEKTNMKKTCWLNRNIGNPAPGAGRMTSTVAVVLLLLLSATLLSAATNDLTSVLQRGLFEEEANHNLDVAIENYQSLAAQFDRDRQVAATAIFRLGECYRKLGRTNEAAAQYQRIVRDFSDQPQLTALSRQNLTGMGAGERQPSNASTIVATESEETSLQAKLSQLKALPRNRLPAALQQSFPDPILTKLFQDRAEVEQRLVALNAQFTDEHPTVINARRLAETINDQINEQVEGILAGLQVRLDAARAAAKLLQDQGGGPVTSSTGNSTTGSTTDEEAQEIRRIEAMIRNSPDLINVSGGEEGITPLIRAAAKDQFQVARFLLDHGADPNRRGGRSETPLLIAAQGGHKSMVELLLDHGAEVNATGGPRLGVSPPGPATALDCAAYRGFQGVVESLLSHKADPNIPGGDGAVPLHRTAAYPAIAELLLAHGADPNAKGAEDRTPLQWIAWSGQKETLSVLLDHKADVNARDKSGATPLHSAASANRAEAIKLLVSHGADVNAADNYGETPLTAAARLDATEAVNALLDARADPNRFTTLGEAQGWGPLHYAASKGNVKIARDLLQHGAKPDAMTVKDPSNGRRSTPLLLALDFNNPEVAKLLLQFKANPNLPDSAGRHPLLLAISNRHSADLAKALLEAGADVNAPVSNDGWRPLQLATAVKDQALVETVLAFKPDVNAMGHDNATALDATRDKPELAEIAARLRKHGAVDDVPRFDRIEVRRPAIGFSQALLKRGTNDWNRFSLLELVAFQYGPLNTSLSGAPRAFPSVLGGVRRSDLGFPDFKHVVIHRPADSGWKEIPVDVDAILSSGDCSRDVWLEWGDAVEIPETDHNMNQMWAGITVGEGNALIKCIARNVTVDIQGTRTGVKSRLKFEDTPIGIPNVVSCSFMVRAVLDASNLIRFSSDLSRVKVTRRDAATGKTREWTVDCRAADSAPDLWLRDGDVVTVPEK